MLLSTCGCQLLFFCLLIRSGQAVKNDATETLNAELIDTIQDIPSNASINQARNGGRSSSDAVRKGESKWLCIERGKSS